MKSDLLHFFGSHLMPLLLPHPSTSLLGPPHNLQLALTVFQPIIAENPHREFRVFVRDSNITAITQRYGHLFFVELSEHTVCCPHPNPMIFNPLICCHIVTTCIHHLTSKMSTSSQSNAVLAGKATKPLLVPKILLMPTLSSSHLCLCRPDFGGFQDEDPQFLSSQCQE